MMTFKIFFFSFPFLVLLKYFIILLFIYIKIKEEYFVKLKYYK